MRHGFTSAVIAAAATLSLAATGAAAQTTGLSGRVVEVAGPEVAVHLCADPMPANGALLEIGFPPAVGEEAGSFGVWRVLEVRECLLWVTAVCGAAAPAVGQSATVLMHAPERPPVYPSQPVVVAPQDRQEVRAAAIASSIADLSSPSSAERRRAAMILYRHYRYEVEVQQAAAQALLAGYAVDTRDSTHVDAMSWLCNILGASGQPAYMATLDEVARQTTSPKIRDYARKNLHRLG